MSYEDLLDKLTAVTIELKETLDHIALIRRTREHLDDLYDRKAVTGADGPEVFAALEAAHVALNHAVRAAIDPSLCTDRAHKHAAAAVAASDGERHDD